jgi:hypothetical protein
MTGTNCDLFTHNQLRSYLNHLVYLILFLTYTEIALENCLHLKVYLYISNILFTSRLKNKEDRKRNTVTRSRNDYCRGKQ